MYLTVFLTAALAAESAPDHIRLLKTFHGEFVRISPGSEGFPATFTMGGGGSGNEGPAHKVTLAYEFQIAKYEVPQDLWEAVMGSNPSKWTGPRNSVEMLSFEEAERFCKLATTEMRSAGLIQKNQTVRLPTEAEWEFVARGGTSTVYSFGDDVKQLDDYGWHTDNASGNDPPVGVKKPNPWGLYDIHGYLWEWCTDHGHDSYAGVSEAVSNRPKSRLPFRVGWHLFSPQLPTARCDRQLRRKKCWDNGWPASPRKSYSFKPRSTAGAPTDGSSWSDKGDQTKRILRGGSWKDKPLKLTSSYRRVADKELRDDAVGLRCVLATEK